MTVTTHLKSLQALEMAMRMGSLKAAANALAITPAALGQRIRALETFLGTDLLLRGRSGLQPTAELQRAVEDLKTAFAALDRVTQTLDFQRITEIHIVAEVDWTELWLMPRLPRFRAENPNILFCINGAGDIPVRIGTPDCRIEYSARQTGELLYRDLVLPVTGPDNLRRVLNKDMPMEGMPLLHLQAQRDDPEMPGWIDWFNEFGQRNEGGGRGVHYRSVRLALEAVRKNVGFLLCGLSLAEEDLKTGQFVRPFPLSQHLPDPHAYFLTLPGHKEMRPQLQKFCDWLRAEAAQTAKYLASIANTE